MTLQLLFELTPSHIAYLQSFLPLLIGHVIVPPLSSFKFESPPLILDSFFNIVYTIIDEIYPNTLLSEKFVNSLILDQRALPDDKTWITHLFVHGDYNHLIGNLSAALQFGYPIYKEFGSEGLYILFLFGGVFASIPSMLYADQKNAFAITMHELLLSIPNNARYLSI
jgi:hypothetical protein